MAEQTQTRPPEMSPTHNLPPPCGAGAGYHHSSLDTYSSMASNTNHPSPPASTDIQGPTHDLAGMIEASQLPIPVTAQGASDLAFLTDRLTIESFAGRDLIQRIQERWSFYNQHIEELDQARRNAVAVRRDWRNPQDSQPYLGDPDLLSEVQRIDGERRTERLALWRDMNELRTILPEQWMKYLSSYRRQALFTMPDEPIDTSIKTHPPNDDVGQRHADHRYITCMTEHPGVRYDA